MKAVRCGDLDSANAIKVANDALSALRIGKKIKSDEHWGSTKISCRTNVYRYQYSVTGCAPLSNLRHSSNLHTTPSGTLVLPGRDTKYKTWKKHTWCPYEKNCQKGPEKNPQWTWQNRPKTKTKQTCVKIKNNFYLRPSSQNRDDVFFYCMNRWSYQAFYFQIKKHPLTKKKPIKKNKTKNPKNKNKKTPRNPQNKNKKPTYGSLESTIHDSLCNYRWFSFILPFFGTMYLVSSL